MCEDATFRRGFLVVKVRLALADECVLCLEVVVRDPWRGGLRAMVHEVRAPEVRLRGRSRGLLLGEVRVGTIGNHGDQQHNGKMLFCVAMCRRMSRHRCRNVQSVQSLTLRVVRTKYRVRAMRVDPEVQKTPEPTASM